MKIFIDSANYQEVAKWLHQGVVDGVTTNPSIMYKDQITNIEEGAIRLASLIHPRPLSVEVTTNDPQEMVEQGRGFRRWADNIVVKIPVINQDGQSCLGAIHTLKEEGIPVNCTAILSFNQAILASKAGATYVSIFAGRVADEGHDPEPLIGAVREWLERWGYESEIIVGSIRSVIDVQSAAIAGAHIITIPPQFLPKMLDHKNSRETVRGFISDAQKTLAAMRQKAPVTR